MCNYTIRYSTHLKTCNPWNKKKNVNLQIKEYKNIPELTNQGIQKYSVHTNEEIQKYT